MRQHRKKNDFNDLLIPIILILAVLPFITRLIIYESGLSGYAWFSDNDIVTDFFSYYKSNAFLIISIISAIILVFYFALGRQYRKDMKLFLLIGIYALFIIVSTIFSTDVSISMVGGTGHFESAIVLLSYLIMMIYAYQIDKKEEDYRAIFKSLVLSLILMCMIGTFQMFGQDLISFPWFQKIIIPREFWRDYVGNIQTHLSSNAVSLTLFNPNFASVYIAMLLPFLITFVLPSKEKQSEQKGLFVINQNERIVCIAIIVIMTMLLFKTYSRTGLISVFISLSVLGYFYRSQLRKYWKQCFGAIMLGVILFVGIDLFNDFRYIEKMFGTVQSFYDEDGNHSLQEILTNPKEVSIRYKGDIVSVAFSEERKENTLVFYNEVGDDITSYYDSEDQILHWKQFEEIKFYIEDIEKERYIYCIINEITWRFYQDKQKGYLYLNDFGKLDRLVKIERIGFKNTEDIGSGRGYIWSRSLPLLKDAILIGKGPDTYPLVFPQSDYVGKANNCKTPYTLIEKPHSLYLMIAIQTGVLSLLALIVFCMFYLLKSFRIYEDNKLMTLKERMGLGCLLATLSFMISGIFNDSSLQTTPVFFVLLGLGMDINYKLTRKG